MTLFTGLQRSMLAALALVLLNLSALPPAVAQTQDPITAVRDAFRKAQEEAKKKKQEAKKTPDQKGSSAVQASEAPAAPDGGSQSVAK